MLFTIERVPPIHFITIKPIKPIACNHQIHLQTSKRERFRRRRWCEMNSNNKLSPPKSTENILFYAHINSHFMFSLHRWTFSEGAVGWWEQVKRAANFSCRWWWWEMDILTETQSLSYSYTDDAFNLKNTRDSHEGGSEKLEKLSNTQQQQQQNLFSIGNLFCVLRCVGYESESADATSKETKCDE